MKKKTLNKLVRDKIPNILIKQDKAFKAHSINGIDLSKHLINKLKEEVDELDEAIENYRHLSNQEPLSLQDCEDLEEAELEEFADIFEVFTNLMKARNYKIEDLQKAVQEKRERNGGFDDQIFLEWVEEK